MIGEEMATTKKVKAVIMDISTVCFISKPKAETSSSFDVKRAE